MNYDVIIPLYNGSKWIEETIDSVLGQKKPPAEIIVVDDCSTDESAVLVSRYKNVQLLKTPQNSGPCIARNVAFAVTSSPLVAFLDQDDVWHPDHISLLQEAMAAKKNAPAAVSGINSFFENTIPVFKIDNNILRSYSPWSFFPFGNLIYTPSAVLIRREVFKKAGSWHAEFTGVADYHLWLLLATHQPFIQIPSITAGRRVHKASLFHSLIRNDPVVRIELRGKAARNAVEYRLRSTQQNNRDYFQTLLILVDEVSHLAKSLSVGDEEELKRSAGRIEPILLTLPDIQRRLMFQYLLYSFTLSVNAEQQARQRQNVVSILLKCWPPEAQLSRKLLLESVT